MSALQGKDATQVWKALPTRYKVDKAFVLKCLGQSKTLPSKTDFDRQFPQSLRFDRDVVLAYARRPDFYDLYFERHLFVPDCLTDDKEVMMAYCKVIPRSLQECSERLCDDRDVVTEAIRVDGMELQYASLRLQEDEQIVKMACLRDGRALEFCPLGELRDKLTSDRDFMLAVIRNNGAPLFRLLAEPLRHDRELVLEALANGMRFKLCPSELRNDDDFLEAAVSRRSALYLEIDRRLQRCTRIAKAAVIAEDSTPAVHERAMELVDELLHDRNVVLAIAKRGDTKIVTDLFEPLQFLRISDDKEIVLAVLQRKKSLYSLISPRLKADPEVVIAAIDASTVLTVLDAVPISTLNQHPEIVVASIECAKKESISGLVTRLSPLHVMMRRDVARAWIRRSVTSVLRMYETMLRSDEEIALDVAKYCPAQFGRVGNSFQNSFDFMKRAVDLNGRVLRYAPRSMRNSRDLTIRAIANTSDALIGLSIGERAAIKSEVSEKLRVHSNFVGEFLRGIATATPQSSPRCRLPMLDQGDETSRAFKQLIADFAGVPVGEELRLYRRAHRNMEDPSVPEVSLSFFERNRPDRPLEDPPDEPEADIRLFHLPREPRADPVPQNILRLFELDRQLERERRQEEAEMRNERRREVIELRRRRGNNAEMHRFLRDLNGNGRRHPREHVPGFFDDPLGDGPRDAGMLFVDIPVPQRPAPIDRLRRVIRLDDISAVTDERILVSRLSSIIHALRLVDLHQLWLTGDGDFEQAHHALLAMRTFVTNIGNPSQARVMTERRLRILRDSEELEEEFHRVLSGRFD